MIKIKNKTDPIQRLALEAVFVGLLAIGNSVDAVLLVDLCQQPWEVGLHILDV